MVYVGKKELNSRYFIVSVLTVLIAALCILKIGGLTATVAVVIYCILLGLTALSMIEQLLKPKAVGIRLGITQDPVNGHMYIDMNKYDQFIETYEHRFSNIWFWVDIPTTMVWVAIFLAGGFSTIAYIIIASYMGLEIGRYEVYKAVKENKDAWVAAMYMNEVKDFFGEKEENNK